MGRKRLDLTGQRYGRLVVIRFEYMDKVQGAFYLCKCDCNKKTVVRSGNLRSGRIRSCGCLKDEVTRIANTTHGHSIDGKRTPEYRIWYSMIQRCTNSLDAGYHRYGGRGIKVCKRWRNSFPKFLKDMGRRPNPSLTLERMNNDGNYEPSNCIWATRERQNANQRGRFANFYRLSKLRLDRWKLR